MKYWSLDYTFEHFIKTHFLLHIYQMSINNHIFLNWKRYNRIHKGNKHFMFDIFSICSFVSILHD